MNNTNYITVSGPTKKSLEAAVQQMADLYADTGYTQGIKIYKSKIEEHFFIRFSIDPDFERFKYFVNYLHYPEVEKYSVRVFGYYTLNEDKIDLGALKNKRLLLYVSDKDTEGDDVNGIFEGGDETIKFGFALGEECRELGYKEFDFKEPIIEIKNYEHVKTVSGSVKEAKLEGGGCLAMVVLMIAFAGVVLFWV